VRFYEVGGAVRDELLGINSKDVDFAVEAPSYEDMKQELLLKGFKIFEERPQFFTIRAQVPPTQDKLFQRSKVADFVLCRKDSDTGDGRRPDSVQPGTILDDLARRDFTVNAIARDPATGELIDPHNGKKDLDDGVLKFVGDPMKRISEDGLRVLRGYRFLVTKELRSDDATYQALRSDLAIDMLRKVSIERVREELEKMFNCDTMASLYMLGTMPSMMQAVIFRDGLRLTPTLKQV
jgi:tRNA nucleotidyltransferase (CCA-adding enzyme)